MEQIETDPQLMNEAQVAALWGVTMGRVAQCRVLGNGPQFTKLPTGDIRYRRSDVMDWLATRVLKRTARIRERAGIAKGNEDTSARLVKLGQELIALAGVVR